MGNRVTEGYETTRPLILDIDIDKTSKSFDPYEQVGNAIKRGIKNGQEELAKRMVLKCKEYLAYYGYIDDELSNSISYKLLRDGVVLSVNAKYAIYVEYGTGIVGSQNPHPKIDRWFYDVKGHGNQGWWYQTDFAYPNQLSFVDPDTGQLWAWTKGQTSKPFMYQTWLWASKSATQIIKKNIRKEIKKISGVK